MRRITSVLAISVVVPITALSAQESPPLEPGVRVRVTAPECGLRRQATTYQAFRGDTLVLDTTECPLASVTWLDVRRGRKSNSALGAVIGAGAGLVWATYRATEECPGPLCKDQIALGSVFCAGGGAIIGSLIGLAIRTDRWEEVPLDRLRVSFSPRRDGVAIGMRIAF